ncbi:Sterol O-acyltransferase 2 (Sterol-ester synthase 2) [Coniosporium apollinis]|uniref:O-acyltransferase n=2 Tax=Coniosporium TaxID=2810619 RepID=A0ABQ9P6A8_9PEZI|nr:Sterol O-acyltransferase 2 (Sterol-ester synthase 2) [Cladosporium sp. JES 115]KAJ9667927.1 Sterol O-acyltransferase 2 (Sterol-ester synthase 2) [Coniosporium apollinis]
MASTSTSPDVPHFDASRLTVLDHSGDDWSAEPSSISDEEDYDELKPDPSAIVEGSKGAGVENEEAMLAGKANTSVSSERSPSYEAVRAPSRNGKSEELLRSRRKSVQVIVEKTNKGRYVLTADDPEIREVLRQGIQREAGDSEHAKKQTQFRDLIFTRRFTTFDRQNPASSGSAFHGFFTLFWLVMGGLLLRVAAQNWRAHGSVFGGAELLHMMFDRDLLVLGLTDGVMCGATAFGLVLQRIILKDWLRWNSSGWIIQNVWQTFYLFAIIGWTWYREWPWTHTIFTVLHAMVFLMKQHSYSFYNGYLSQVYRRRALLEQKLKQLEKIEPIASPISPSHSPTRAFSFTSLDQSGREGLLQRRRSIESKTSTNLRTEKSEIADIATAIESGQPLDLDQLQAFEQIIRSEIRVLTEELKGKCTTTSNSYPNNLTLWNWADWTCLPTLVYELEYPRQDHINWWYVAEKTAATFGVIWVMMVISQAYIYPPVAETVRMKEAGWTLQERWNEFPWILSDMLIPLLLEQLLSWYVIWECVLNVLAEITRFADRGFYGDWWNSVSWDQYARDWNRPVHNFLLRHVYHSSISAFHLSKMAAMFVTFLLSACVHELVMLCLFKKVRGYLFAMQLAQLPLAALSRTRLMKGKNVLGNVMFWLGLFIGPSLLTSLYLIV